MKLKLPIIVVNFKAYEQSTGKNALALAKIHQKVAQKTGVQFAIAVQPIDIHMIASEIDLPVLAQHFDPVEFGAYTGHLSPHALLAAGAMGSLLNHAERKLPLEVLQKSIELARKVGFFTLVCADTAEAGKEVKPSDPFEIKLHPTPAYEKWNEGVQRMRKERADFIAAAKLPPFQPKQTDEPKDPTQSTIG